MAQTAGAIVIRHDSGTGRKNIVLMLGVDKAKFRKPAIPGDRIEFHIAKIQRRRNVGRYEARAMVDGTIIAEAEITAMIVEATS
jgi:3-hydroxyacyl-[acyl-carrier-protein] dehydratase